MAEQLYEGRHRIKERAVLKTGKKQNRGAPYLLVLHNSCCRRLQVKVFLCRLCSSNEKSPQNWMDTEQCTRGRGGTRKSAKTYWQKICEILYSICWLFYVLSRDHKNPGTPMHKIINFNKIFTHMNAGIGRAGVYMIKKCYTTPCCWCRQSHTGVLRIAAWGLTKLKWILF